MRYKFLFILGFLGIIILAILFLFPIYWTLTGSFKIGSQTYQIPPRLFPSRISFLNYTTILTDYAFPRWVFNTMVVAICEVIFGVSIACMSGYAFAKKNFLGKEILFWSALATMMIPFYVVIIPLYITMRKFGLYNTYPGIFLPGLGSAGSMFLARQYISTIPSQLLDSARIDGASEFQVFSKIILPISKPLIAALCIFGFVGTWRNYFWPLVMTSSDSVRTVAVGITQMAARPGGLNDIGIAMAGATLVMIPIFIVFFSFQKYFIRGITLGGVKG